MNSKIDEIKLQYALPVYNLENVKEIPNSEIQFSISDQLFLETLLMELRGKSISYSSHLKKQRDKTETFIKEQIRQIEENLTDANLLELDTLRHQLEKIQTHKLQESLLRSKVQWTINGEKPTKLFCNLEKKQHFFKNHKLHSKRRRHHRYNTKRYTKRNSELL